MVNTFSASRGPRETLEVMLPLLRDGDMHGLVDLYAENGVHELPFAPPGVPGRIEGRERIRSYLTAPSAGEPLDFQEFRPVAVHDTTDPEVIIAEYEAHGEVTGTGSRFVVRYVWVLRIVGGEILSWRDYWNPGEVLALQGLLPSTGS